MAAEYTGVGGVRRDYAGSTETGVPGVESRIGVVEELTVSFTYDTLPGLGNAGADPVVSYIPANALIVASYFEVTTDFDSTSGTTTIDLGTAEADGTEIDLDGIDVDVVTADGSNAGWTVNDGVDIGTAASATADAYLQVTPSTEDLEAGAATWTVQFIRTAA